MIRIDYAVLGRVGLLAGKSLMTPIGSAKFGARTVVTNKEPIKTIPIKIRAQTDTA